MSCVRTCFVHVCCRGLDSYQSFCICILSGPRQLFFRRTQWERNGKSHEKRTGKFMEPLRTCGRLVLTTPTRHRPIISMGWVAEIFYQHLYKPSDHLMFKSLVHVIPCSWALYVPILYKPHILIPTYNNYRVISFRFIPHFLVRLILHIGVGTTSIPLDPNSLCLELSIRQLNLVGLLPEHANLHLAPQIYSLGFRG